LGKIFRKPRGGFDSHGSCVGLSECVRLPEIPPDTPETNPLMCLHDHPQFNNISPDMVVTGCAKRCIEFDVQLGRHVEKLKGEAEFFLPATE